MMMTNWTRGSTPIMAAPGLLPLDVSWSPYYCALFPRLTRRHHVTDSCICSGKMCVLVCKTREGGGCPFSGSLAKLYYFHFKAFASRRGSLLTPPVNLPRPSAARRAEELMRHIRVAPLRVAFNQVNSFFFFLPTQPASLCVHHPRTAGQLAIKSILDWLAQVYSFFWGGHTLLI